MLSDQWADPLKVTNFELRSFTFCGLLLKCLHSLGNIIGSTFYTSFCGRRSNAEIGQQQTHLRLTSKPEVYDFSACDTRAFHRLHPHSTLTYIEPLQHWEGKENVAKDYIESDLQPLNIGLFPTWRRAQDRYAWTHTVEMPALQPGAYC